MPGATEIDLSDEFASTMQLLVAEAEKSIPPTSVDFADRAGDPEGTRDGFAALNDRLASLERLISNRFDEAADPAPAESELSGQLQRLDEHMAAIRKTESVNQRLFNSLHEELKSYRDNFLRESLQKPFIRDLVMLYDDLTGLSSQMEMAAGAAESRQGAPQWGANLQNAIHSLVEILHRMEVNEIELMEMVDRALHRVVTYEPADCAEDNGRIVTRIKRGFVWRDQVLRPEEVVAKRFD